nr:MAG TPA: hypothetical protein [Caudoviricetes sp.]
MLYFFCLFSWLFQIKTLSLQTHLMNFIYYIVFKNRK